MASSDKTSSFARLRESIISQDAKRYWRSIEEQADTPEFRDFIAQEYPHEYETWDEGLSRRNFVKVMGASLALAGLTGCVIQPPEKIVPYVQNPEGQLPGVPLFLATAMSLGGVSTGLLAKAYEGRPIKVEGNPDHPGSQGATDIFAQASILNMYDPDRSEQVKFRGTVKTWEAFAPTLRAAVDSDRASGGAGIRFLTETLNSPTLIDQFKRLSAELPNAKLVQYDPINNDNAMAGAKLAFGSPVHSVYKFDKAERILTLDHDIFSDFNVGYIKDFSKGRAYNAETKQMNRLYAVESTVSLTGAKADHRLAVKPSQIAEVAKAIAKAVGVAGANSAYSENAAWVNGVAKDLTEHKGRSLVVAGRSASPAVHAIAHAMNEALGNVGQTVIYTDPIAPGSDKLQIEQLRELVQDIDAGKVKLLVILGGNPVYNTPADLKLDPDRLNKVELRVHLGSHFDETAEYCHWHVNQKHFLEGWSDGRAFDGTATIVQPLIAPLYDGKNAHELVQLCFKADFDKKDYDIVRAYWQTQDIKPAAAKAEAKPEAKEAPKAATKASETTVPAAAKAEAVPAALPASGSSFEDNWRRAVHNGIVPNTALAAKNVSVNASFLSQPETKAAGSGTVEIAILPDPSVYDGRFANNGWLQELPNPLNKITWENVGLVSPKTAEKLGINRKNNAEELVGGMQGTAFIDTKGGNQYSDLAKIKYQGAEIEKPVPMWITPGQPDDVITIFMGYGRTRAGKVGTGLGYNAYDVRRSDAMDHGFGDVTRTGEQTDVASTQIHFNMEGRDILRSWDIANIDEEIRNGKQENFYDKSMYPREPYEKLYDENTKWAMSIDLNSCVGCNACVVACQAENNIPVVGKEQVNRSREMHWIRIDAYYGGESVNDPEGPHFQPMLCQQCEQAPCEVVCPVAATVHSAEGLNDMVYNRCVGTRYCSNNCPYKVRRFNFLLYQDWNTPQYKLMRNPEVTIRSRGVMEKCTYCIQRISAARIEARKDGGRKIRDGEVVTACQSVCPTNAIVFGDMGDPNSAVAKAKKDERDYVLLNELNTQPRTTYLAGLTNQNKEMPDFRPPVSKPGHHSETKAGGEGH
ncbi:MAG: TAT-variant-translocated molybdopterin oxidoreductase [Acidobacteria bacterium]|nr:TAT-variant-translocated molybdopterin oxidoreductase [Acidobacteriota bacterium]